ncbi:hypothetical protein O3G_MSEX009142, partial [Manduca sexta]
MFKTNKWLPPECVVPKMVDDSLDVAGVRHRSALITMLALGFDLAIPLGTTRTPSETRRVMWVIDLAVVTIIAIVGGYQAPAHMRRLIDFVNRVQQITSDLHASSKCPKSSDDRMYCCVVFALIFLFTVLFGDLLSYIYIAIEKEERVWVAVMYSGYYCSNVITRLIKVQFMLTATYVLSALRLINSKLNNLQKKYDQYHVTSVGESDAQTIRHLSLSYGAVCKIIKEIDKSYGTVLLLLLGMMFLHLIVTLYYIINDIIGIDSTGYDKFETFTKPILQAIWCTFHTWNLFMIIEPSHKTHEEVERTRELISQFMCTLPLQMSEPLQMELEVFGKRLLLDCVAYSPHQVLTLTRSLVVTKSRPPECVVPKSIGVVLRISQAFGVAPVRLTVKPDGYVVQFSPSVSLYGYAIIIAFSLTSVIALGFDLSVPLGQSVRMRSETRRVVWVVDLAIVTILGIVGGYQAPAHMKSLIDIVNRVQKISSELKVSVKSPKTSDNRQYRYVIIALIILFTIMIFDCFNIIYITLTKEHRVWVAAMYSCYYCSYIITQLLEIQFILLAAYILSALKLINSRLRNLQKKYNHYLFSPAKGEDAQTIRHLSLSYGAVCEIIKEMNKSYSTVLLLLIGSFLLHLIVTLYYIITNIFCMMERTKELISQFMCTLTLKVSDPMQVELELFCRRLMFSQVKYSPHQVCTLTRSLIATV